MTVEIGFFRLDETTLGINAAYGEDEHGEFHMTTIGFLFFGINFIKYL